MIGRVTKYRINNDAPSEVFEAASEQERQVRLRRDLPASLSDLWRLVPVLVLSPKLQLALDVECVAFLVM